MTPDKVTRDKSSNKSDNSDEGGTDAAMDAPLSVPADRYGLSADVVARYFGRKIVRLSTLSVYAPAKMILLRTDLKPADPFQGTDRRDKIRRLEATLTSAQWQLLGSSDGLGRGDLSQEQLPIFDDVLPKTMTINQEKTRKVMTGDVLGLPVEGSERTLSDSERGDVRIHVSRRANFHPVDAKNHDVMIVNPFHAATVGTIRPSLVETYTGTASKASIFGQTLRYEAPNRLKPSDLDLKQPLLEETFVPVTGAKTVHDLLHAVRAKTGLELYADERLGRLTIYLSTESRSVRASDLLEALCWSLTATYRKLGPAPGTNAQDFAYVLTYDRIGLAAIRGAIADWARRGGVLRDTSNARLDAAINAAKPKSYLHFADDPLAPLPTALQALRDSQNAMVRSDDYSAEATVPVSALTAEQRAQMADGFKVAEDLNGKNITVPAIRPDRVGLSLGLETSFIVPGIGEVHGFSSRFGNSDTIADDDAIDSHTRRSSAAESEHAAKEKSERLASLQLGPVSLPHVVLCIAPQSIEDAIPVIAVARELHVASVWIDAPATDIGRQLIAGCVAAGQLQGVPVSALVSVIYAPDTSEKMSPAEADLNLFGETNRQWATHIARLQDGLDLKNSYMFGPPEVDKRDLLAPDSPESRTHIARHLREIAGIPHLAGLALHDTAVSGHDWSADPIRFVTWPGTDFGYTVANRLSFLRQRGYDPIDLEDETYLFGLSEITLSIKLPRFDTDGSDNIGAYNGGDSGKIAFADWLALCVKSEADLLTTLRIDLKRAQPQLPVYLGTHDDMGEKNYPGYYQRWSEATQVPFAAPGKLAANKEETLRHIFVSADPRATFQEELGDAAESGASLPDVPTSAYLASEIRRALSFKSSWRKEPAFEGVILDLSRFSGTDLSQAIPLLRGALRGSNPVIDSGRP